MDSSAAGVRHVVLVSSDSFIEGLVRGFCLANCLDLEVRRLVTGIIRDVDSAPPRLLIVDRRSGYQLNGEHPALCPETMSALRQNAQTPLCIISDSAESLAGQYLLAHDYVIGEPLAEQLDQCLRKYTGQNQQATSERRRRERRERQDRREREDRRRAAAALSRTLALRRKPSHEPEPTADFYAVGPFSIDAASREVTMNGQELCLSSKEFQLFHMLASNAGRVLTADAIIVELWPENSRANKSDLYQYIHLLRRKIEVDSQNPRWLVTVKGVGYRLLSRPTESILLSQSHQ